MAKISWYENLIKAIYIHGRAHKFYNWTTKTWGPRA